MLVQMTQFVEKGIFQHTPRSNLGGGWLPVGSIEPGEIGGHLNLANARQIGRLF